MNEIKIICDKNVIVTTKIENRKIIITIKTDNDQNYEKYEPFNSGGMR